MCVLSFRSPAAREAAQQRALESVSAADVTECAETLHPTCFEMTAPEYETVRFSRGALAHDCPRLLPELRELTRHVETEPITGATRPAPPIASPPTTRVGSFLPRGRLVARVDEELRFDVARRGSGGRGGGAGGAAGGFVYLFGVPWVVGYFAPWAIAVVGVVVAGIVALAVTSAGFRARVNQSGRLGIFLFLWITGGIAHGSSLRADSDREKSEREARAAARDAAASRERAEAERARRAEEDARQSVIAGEEARPLADRVGEVGVLLAGVGRGARVPRAALCYGLALSRDATYAELPSDLRHVFDRALTARRAQELSRLRREAEEDRGVICRDGDSSDCDCHGSHQGCCSHHGGVARCEEAQPVSIECPEDERLAEAYLIETNRLTERRGR